MLCSFLLSKKETGGLEASILLVQVGGLVDEDVGRSDAAAARLAQDGIRH
jgi:hypothetical protein